MKLNNIDTNSNSKDNLNNFDPNSVMESVIKILSMNVRNDCALDSENDPWKLLIMARLSAQCTDIRVNIVCKDLFKIYPKPIDLAYANIIDIENIIKSCGLYHSKAKSIKEISKIIVEEYNGIVPSDMDSLLKMPGVGRKIANLIRGDLFNLGGIVTDTHCIRICGRLGFYSEELKDPYKVEKILDPLVKREEQTDFCHRIVWFGRTICDARNPKCKECYLNHLCMHYKNNKT